MLSFRTPFECVRSALPEGSWPLRARAKNGEEALHEPSPGSGVSAERRNSWEQRPAALCRDAATPRPVSEMFLPKAIKAKAVVLSAAGFSMSVLLVWFFPKFWFARSDPAQGYFWLSEQTNVAGWRYTHQPVSRTAEAFLVADHLVSGEFTKEDGTRVRVFSAKRYSSRENEIGLFSHTPDRCWTAVGWKLEPAAPDVAEVPVHGIHLRFERRIFTAGGQRELLYFGALVGGQPLPYRLDQFLSSAQRVESPASADKTGTLTRLRQGRMWGWIWESFVNRRPLIGPQQYLRISVPLKGITADRGDEVLRDFLSRWLLPADYSRELRQQQTRLPGGTSAIP